MLVINFWFFSGLAMISALLCITRRSPVVSAMWLVVTMFSIAALYIILGAQFIGAIQVLVYAGAIMVLFLFVIMLLNLGRDEPTDLPGWWGHAITFGIGTVLIVELWAVTKIVPAGEIRLPAGTMDRVMEEEGVVGAISSTLFRDYLVPFEIASVLLLAAVVGAVVLAKRRL
jgi:NADH-quinone oxidoreductase subunit J